VVDRLGVEALQGAELTSTNRSCGLITITFFVRCTVYEVEALDCSSRHADFERFVASLATLIADD
jgi:hypothetical protein